MPLSQTCWSYNAKIWVQFEKCFIRPEGYFVWKRFNRVTQKYSLPVLKSSVLRGLKKTENMEQSSYRLFKSSRLCTNPDMSLSVINKAKPSKLCLESQTNRRYEVCVIKWWRAKLFPNFNGHIIWLLIEPFIHADSSDPNLLGQNKAFS